MFCFRLFSAAKLQKTFNLAKFFILNLQIKKMICQAEKFLLTLHIEPRMWRNW